MKVFIIVGKDIRQQKFSVKVIQKSVIVDKILKKGLKFVKIFKSIRYRKTKIFTNL